MLILFIKNTTNNTIHTLQELHIFQNHLKFNYNFSYLDVIRFHQ